MERVLKLIVRGRKNAQFYKTLAGAHVGDVITTLIATCELNGINCFDYLTVLQQYRRMVEENTGKVVALELPADAGGEPDPHLIRPTCKFNQKANSISPHLTDAVRITPA